MITLMDRYRIPPHPDYGMPKVPPSIQIEVLRSGKLAQVRVSFKAEYDFTTLFKNERELRDDLYFYRFRSIEPYLSPKARQDLIRAKDMVKAIVEGRVK